MSTFALDKNYDQFNFEEISIAELGVISGGSGGSYIPGGIAGGGCTPTFPTGGTGGSVWGGPGSAV